MHYLAASLLALSSASTVEAPPLCASRIPDYANWVEAPGQQWDYRGDRIYIIGAEHARDPGHPQFARIAALFEAAKPDIVFYEGPDRGVGADAADTIRTGGESGYLRFMAQRAGAEIRRLEPSPPEQFGALLKEFPADQVALFFTLREAARLRDREHLEGARLDAAIAALLGKMHAAGFSSLPFADIAGLAAAAARYWPHRDWRTLPSNWFSPLTDDAAKGSIFIGRINRADSDNRNHHIVEILAAALGEGKRVFVVIGRNHVPMLAPALDCVTGAGGSQAKAAP